MYKALTVLYSCNSCVDCVTVFALFLFVSTLDLQLRWPQTDKQIELSLFQVSVCVSDWVLAAARLRATNAWGGPVPPVSSTLPSQPAGAVGLKCARGLPNPTHLHAPGHWSFCRLPLRRPYSQSHISTHMISQTTDQCCSVWVKVWFQCQWNLSQA